jgi:hypothetical protein
VKRLRSVTLAPDCDDGPARKPMRGSHTRARYTETENPAYHGNPLIEALPPLRSRAEIAALTTYLPLPPTPAERALPTHVREHLLVNVSAFKVPLSQDLDLCTRLDLLLRAGYVSRDPFSRTPGDDLDAQAATFAVLHDIVWCTARQLTMLGISGGGKSIGIRAGLAAIPQTIAHSAYAGEPFLATQVPWLVVDCPHDGSARSLCVRFFRELDHVLRSIPRSSPAERTTLSPANDPPAQHRSLVDQYVKSGMRANDLLDSMEQVAELVHLGLLVIDEVGVDPLCRTPSFFRLGFGSGGV